MRWILPVLAVCGLALLTAHSQVDKTNPALQTNLAKAASALAAELGAQLVKNAPTGKSTKFRVAIFPFGDKEGKYPLEMGDSGPMLRGELVDALRLYLDKYAPGKFTIPYPEQLDEQIRDGSADPVGVSSKNTQLARKVLKGLAFDVGVVGRIEVTREELVGGKVAQSVKISTTAILPETTLSAGTLIKGSEITRISFGPDPVKQERLTVGIELQVDPNGNDGDPKNWTPQPLWVSKQKEKAGLLYLVLPKDARDKRYRITLNNRGTPAVDDNEFYMDYERIFAVSVFIDGVNEQMRRDGNQYRYLSGNPETMPKRILSPVGRRFVGDKVGIPGRVKGAKLINVDGPGGAQGALLGFQKGNDKAAAFVFARGHESVAAPELLSSRKIGTISAYFFAEKLEGDGRKPKPVSVDDVQYAAKTASADFDSSAGTKAGKEVHSPTFHVDVLNWKPDWQRVVRIIYRYEGDESLPRDLEKVK